MKASRFNFILSFDDSPPLLLNTAAGTADTVPQDALPSLTPGGLWEADVIPPDYERKGFVKAMGPDEAGETLAARTGQLARARKETPAEFVVFPGSRDTVPPVFEAIRSVREHAGEGPAPVVRWCPGTAPEAADIGRSEHILAECAVSDWPVRISLEKEIPVQCTDWARAYPVEAVVVELPPPSRISGTGDTHPARLFRRVDRLLRQGPTRVELRIQADDQDPERLCLLADDIIARQWYMTPNFRAVLVPPGPSGQRNGPPVGSMGKVLEGILDMMAVHPRLEVFDLEGWGSFQAVRQFVLKGRFPSFPGCDPGLNRFVFTPAGEIIACNGSGRNAGTCVGRYKPGPEVYPERLSDWYEPVLRPAGPCRDCFLMPLWGSACRHWLDTSGIQAGGCQREKELFRKSVARAFAQGDLP